MGNKNESALLERLHEVIKELQILINHDPKQSFIIMARDANFNDSVHMLATAGSTPELIKNTLGFLALSSEQEFISAALELYERCEVCKVKSETVKEMKFTTKNNNLS